MHTKEITLIVNKLPILKLPYEGVLQRSRFNVLRFVVYHQSKHASMCNHSHFSCHRLYVGSLLRLSTRVFGELRALPCALP